MENLRPDAFEECFRPRANMLETKKEEWRPPLFSPPGNWRSDLLARVRRFFDLQAGSIWNDLTGVLPRAEGTVLDVGCGAQPYRVLLGPKAQYRGIDTAGAKPHFGYEMPDTTYYEGDVWPVADASVDFILCTETLEHVLDSRQFLGQARRCLRPGGTLLLTVPFAARWHFIPYDYWRFTPSCLDQLLRGCGFAGTRVYARGNAGTVACYKMMAIMLHVLLPQSSSPLVQWTLRLIGLPLIPLVAILAAIGNWTLRGRGGDDCLGYTALATKPLTDGRD
jgi:SAM-dependent methyltransferase